MYEETTIAAIATAPGEGGIGIIRLSGVSALEIADKIFHTGKIKTFKDAVPRMMYFGHVADGGKRIDEGLAVYMKAPHSYTGEDVVEIQIHGSAEALRETLALALRSGAVPAMRGEFTKRAFLNGRLDLAQAEAVMDIISAKGEAALTQAESHLYGALSGFVHGVMEELKDLITKLEVTIDYPEEDLEDLTMEETGDALEKIDKSLSALLKRSEEGRVIREGLRTAIIGRPNAGKSSLLNALLQEERAIVTDVPGTTRDTIEEAVRISGVSLLLMDTAGLRETDNKVEQIGIERARASMEKADLILAVIDGSSPLDEEDKTEMVNAFYNNFIKDNATGIAPVDANLEFTPLKIDPKTIDAEQMKDFKDEVLYYYGVSEKILKGEYTEDEWSAFYEGVLEPLAVSLSQNFTAKVLTAGARSFGNKIIFGTQRLQYASNRTKALLISLDNVLTTNEKREILNLPSIEGGDVILQSLNYVNSKIADEYQLGKEGENGQK